MGEAIEKYMQHNYKYVLQKTENKQNNNSLFRTQT